MGSRSRTLLGAWPALERELDLWQARGLHATFWWRDDDAIADTPALRQLNALSQSVNVPVTLAVIPAQFEVSLAHYLAGCSNFSVFQHGYAHASFAAAGEKKREMGGVRETQSIQEELAQGRAILQREFADQFIPVLVPPWNRIDKRVIAVLPATGFLGISSMWSRKRAEPAKNLLQVNTHFDPVNWRRDRGFVGEYRGLAQVHRHLFARRSGRRDLEEPTGLLTHHLDQGAEVWDFCHQFIEKLSAHPAVSWLSARDIWLPKES